ncbi:hypothetical protein [Georgenia alba]|uniref:ATP synthase protein I n=1 Tax=Georgenia alba TaxID=2233858 RepID=A0ABW2Q9W6_9MICO
MSQPESSTHVAVRAMYSTMIRRTAVLVAVLAVGGGVVGYLLAGMPGVWGALLGATIAALFMVATVVTMLLTADRPLTVVNVAVVVGLLVKLLLVFGVLVLLRGRDFYDPGVLFGVLVVAVIGSLLIEAVGVMTTRMPTVEPTPSAPVVPTPDDEADPDTGGRPSSEGPSTSQG